MFSLLCNTVYTHTMDTGWQVKGQNHFQTQIYTTMCAVCICLLAITVSAQNHFRIVSFWPHTNVLMSV